ARLLNPRRDPITLPAPAPGVHPEQLADIDAALAWFTAEHAVLLASVRQAAATGFDTHTWALAWTLVNFLERRGHWRDWVEVQHAALLAAQRLGEPRREGAAHHLLANAYLRLDRYAEAREHLQCGLRLFEGVGDGNGQADIHHSLARMSERTGDYPAALRHTERSYALYRATGNLRRPTASLNRPA